MDTRTKILDPEEIPERFPNYTLLRASFDVLTRTRVQRVRELANSSSFLVAAVEDEPDSLLPAAARAELAAAIGIIDGVVILKNPDAPPSALLSHAAEVIDERTAERLRTVELIHHVERRNAS